jgi:hypothetical protein
MITKISTPFSGVIVAMYVLVALLMVMTYWRSDSAIAVTVRYAFIAGAIAAIVISGIKTYMKFRYIAGRTPRIAELARQLVSEKSDEKPPTLSSNFLALEPRDPRMFNIVSGADWRYADFSHTIYKKLKNGEYKAAYMFYSVLELDLQRALPTMLFDSPKTHSKQFERYFDKEQEHHLEGNFDKYFVTYFPKYYSIDALSIITPEVMQAMIEAKDYDIEIDGNKLYLYGPLIPVEQLPDFMEMGKAVRKKLMNNLVTYRDERLDAAAGRSGVSVFGAELRRSSLMNWPLFIVGFFLVVLFFTAPDYRIDRLIYGILFLIASGWSMWRRRRKNKLLDQKYEQHMKFLEMQKSAIKSSSKSGS